MKNKKIIILSLIVLLLLIGAVFYFNSENKVTSTNNETTTSNGYLDEDLDDMTAEVVDKYQVNTYDGMEYNLYIPENYDKSKEYPLVVFIPDASLVGKSAETQLTQGYGGIIWATEHEQAKHPCFVLVPVITDNLAGDDGSTGSQVNTVISLVKELENNYTIDQNRAYITGQSMGCMAAFSINANNSDLFAASLYVSGQRDNETFRAVEDDKFFYIVSAGDAKASEGLTNLKTILDEDDIPYAYGENWDAQWSDEEFKFAVDNLTKQNRNINLAILKEGTTLNGQSADTMAGEHMTSFDYIYKIDAVRDWLFAQSN